MATIVLRFSVSALENINLYTFNFLPVASGSLVLVRIQELSFYSISLGPYCTGRLSHKLFSDFYLLFFQSGNTNGRSIGGLSVLDTTPKSLDLSSLLSRASNLTQNH